MDATLGLDGAAAIRLLLVGAALASLPLTWVWWRRRAGDWRGRLALLTTLTLFLTFDLVVFGSFTRLTDSGLGCPDWPGCYGHASPLGAGAHIEAAQQAQPGGPVSWGKAWVEMVHRYLAMAVGALIATMAGISWALRRRLPHSLAWPLLTLGWVLVQGLFGRYTVTLKLYPAIVTLHLLGGLGLLVLLVIQREAFAARPLPLQGPGRRLAGLAAGLLLLQIALGGWLSANYAVLACAGFPSCNGSWWPAADYGQGFTLLRELGRAGSGGFLPFDALVAIHWTHRVGALFSLGALLLLLLWLWRSPQAAHRPFARALGGLAALQLLSGMSNVLLDWPLAAALLHSAGAAALVVVLGSLLVRARAGVAQAQRAGAAAVAPV